MRKRWGISPSWCIYLKKNENRWHTPPRFRVRSVKCNHSRWFSFIEKHVCVRSTYYRYIIVFPPPSLEDIEISSLVASALEQPICIIGPYSGRPWKALFRGPQVSSSRYPPTIPFVPPSPLISHPFALLPTISNSPTIPNATAAESSSPYQTLRSPSSSS